MDSSISVVIPSARDYPRRLIDELRGQTRGSDEIVLVNDDTWTGEEWSLGSSAGEVGDRESVESRPRRGPDTRDGPDKVFQTTGRGGGAEARNVGWRASSNEWVLFVNDDMRVTPRTLGSVRESIAEHGDADVVSFRVRSQADDPIARLSDATVSLDRGRDGRRTSGSPLELHRVREFGAGAALLANREVLAETGGYKDELGPGRPRGGTDDIEFLWHVSHHGGRIVYDPDVVFDHPPPGSLEEWRGKVEDYARGVGYLAGAVGTSAAERWASDYCEILESVESREVFESLPADLQLRARRALHTAADHIRTVYDETLRAEDELELLCEECSDALG